MNFLRRLLSADLGLLFRKCFRFNLRVLLLTLIVAATITKVFFLPKPHPGGAGALKIETFRRKVARKPDPNVRVRLPPDLSRGERHGRWQIRTGSRHVLATGHFEMGRASGAWRYYDLQGNTLSAGRCAHNQLSDRWTVWNADGSVNSTAHSQTATNCSTRPTCRAVGVFPMPSDTDK